MNKKTIVGMLWVLSVVCLTSATLPAVAQRSLRMDPGYVDLEKVGGWSGFFNRDPKIDVRVEGALMDLVAEASRTEDPELADLLLKLKGVFVQGFETPRSEMDRARSRANQIGNDLVELGWSSVIRVRNDEEHFQMFAKYRGEEVIGMVVLSIRARDLETMFLNIVGAIDPAQIGKIGQKFNLGEVPRRE